MTEAKGETKGLDHAQTGPVVTKRDLWRQANAILSGILPFEQAHPLITRSPRGRGLKLNMKGLSPGEEPTPPAEPQR